MYPNIIQEITIFNHVWFAIQQFVENIQTG